MSSAVSSVVCPGSSYICVGEGTRVWAEARAVPFCRLLFLASWLAAGCQNPAPGSLDVAAARFDGQSLAPIADGDSVELTRPIQGGHVLFIGAYVRGASGSDGTIRGELRRGETDIGQPLLAPGAIIVFEERLTTLEALSAGVTPPSASPGWQQVRADLSDLANIPACPNFLSVEIPDRTLYLQVVYTDSKGNTGTAAKKVVPRCAQTDPAGRNTCLCECHANYTIDRCFMSSDAGTTD